MSSRKFTFSHSLCDIPGVLKVTCKALYRAFAENVGREMWNVVSAIINVRSQLEKDSYGFRMLLLSALSSKLEAAFS